MLDTQLCLEALSALSGCNVEQTDGASQLTPQDFVNVVALREFYRQEGFKEIEYPSIGTLSLQDLDGQDLYSSPLPLAEGPAESPPESFRNTVTINPADFFDRAFDYDFTHIQDGNKKFMRGNEVYIRPCGWNRVALRVVQKYTDGDVWLGTGKDAWPVSYHGQNMDGSLGIIWSHGSPEAKDDPELLDAAASFLVTEQTKGRGVYSTLDIKIADKYCKKFKSRVDGKTYKVVLQNRINPEKRQKCQRENVWLVYIPEGSTNVMTRAIVQESIRPYGLLIKQV